MCFACAFVLGYVQVSVIIHCVQKRLPVSHELVLGEPPNKVLETKLGLSRGAESALKH